MLSVVTEEPRREHVPSVLDEIVREGARRMLAAALEAEVAAFIEAHADERDDDGRRLVVRNGHAERADDHDRCWTDRDRSATGDRQAHRRGDW